MENASKALLVAAAILIVIVLITFGIRILNSAGDTAKQAQGLGDSISSATTSKVESLLSGLGGGSSNLNHSGIIPEGGKYISNDGTTYEAGDTMPSQTKYGDVYIYGNYKYTKEGSGWKVSINIGKNEAEYGVVLESINENKITNMQGTFSNCTALKKPPKIPDSVTNMNSTFWYCTSLESVPKIPNGVTSMNATFLNCSLIKEPPILPDTVTSLDSTFYGCESLEKAPKIPDNVINMERTFIGCSALKEAPTIPSGVINMNQTFQGCSLLVGKITINANPTEYNSCFTLTKKAIEIIGACSEETKKNLAATSSRGNVTY